ncbi:unnamed protein product [Rotaria socialis]
MNKPSTSSLIFIDKPECLNCSSQLNDDNLECPYCTQVFCRICIESSCDSSNHEHYCPTCYNKKNIDCLDPNCSALFCYECCKKLNEKLTSNVTEELNSTVKIMCPQCGNAEMYGSNVVMYYSYRIIEYKIAQESESKSDVSISFPNTVWTNGDYVPESGTLEENYNRIISVIHFNADHIQFSDKKEHCPLLIINEPAEYTCPENDNNVRLHQYNQSLIAAYISHFISFTARNNRFKECVTLDDAFLDRTYDYDFTTSKDANRTFQRGPEPYTRLCGWDRKAIKVLGNMKMLNG